MGSSQKRIIIQTLIMIPIFKLKLPSTKLFYSTCNKLWQQSHCDLFPVKNSEELFGHLLFGDHLQKKRRLCMLLHTQNKTIAWERSLHFAMPLLVCPPNYGWGTSAEIPHWWRVTTWIWVALLIGCSKSIRSTRYVRFGSDTSFRGKISGDVMRCWLF